MPALRLLFASQQNDLDTFLLDRVDCLLQSKCGIERFCGLVFDLPIASMLALMPSWWRSGLIRPIDALPNACGRILPWTAHHQTEG